MNNKMFCSKCKIEIRRAAFNIGNDFFCCKNCFERFKKINEEKNKNKKE